jgi:hypothetical protein
LRKKTKMQAPNESGEKEGICPKEKLPGRTGMPDGDSILAEKEFESPSGRKYRILKTDERDEYEEETEGR